MFITFGDFKSEGSVSKRRKSGLKTRHLVKGTGIKLYSFASLQIKIAFV